MHRFLWSTSLVLAWLAIASEANAATLEVNSAIGQVVVFPRGASVTRSVDLDLPAGATTLRFNGLPNDMAPDSLQVSGAGASGLVLGAIENAIAATQTSMQPNDLGKRIKALQDERDSQQVIIDTLDAKRQMMLNYANTSPEKLTLNNKPLDISQWGVAFDSLAASLAKTGDELRLARAKGKAFEDALASLNQPHDLQLRDKNLSQDRLARSVSVHVVAASAIHAKISLTYLVANAGWQAVYDARLNSGEPVSLQFTRRAIVTQNSGEDWQNVSLEVSSVKHTQATQPPELFTSIVDFPPEFSPLKQDSAKRGALLVPAPTQLASTAMLQSALTSQAVLNTQGYQVNYKVPDTVSLPGNGTSGAFVLQQDEWPAKLALQVEPAISRAAFILASTSNKSDAAILPGRVNLYRDGVFVGHIDTGVIPSGELLHLGFGTDDGVKVTRVPINIKANETTWLGQTKTETHDYETKIQNLHDFAVKVEVVDQIPVSENAAIIVETLPQTAPNPTKDGKGRRGILHWQFDLAAKSEKDVRLAWRIKSPMEKDVIIHLAPNAALATRR